MRILRREPFLSLTTAAVLSTGIGATTTMYSIVTGLRQELPLPDAHELVAIARHDPAGRGTDLGFDPATFDAVRASQTTMTDVSAYRPLGVQIDGWPGAPTRAVGLEISTHAFDLLGVQPVVGRLPSESDANPAAPPVVLIGENHWREAYGSDPGAVGSSLRINGVARTIIGILPGWFRFPVNQTVWVPLQASGLEGPATTTAPFQLFGRLQDGVGVERAQADIRRAAATVPGSARTGKTVVTVRPFQEAFLGQGRVAHVLLLVVSFVLVIASANVASVLLGRALSRRKEVAVRMALGGSRGRIRLQFLSEAAVLAALGVGIGVALTWLGVSWFDRAILAPYVDLWWTAVEVDRQALVFACVCGLGAALMAGIAPALQASDVDLVDAMRVNSSGATSGRGRGLAGWLVTAQLALSCTLLILTAVLVQEAVDNEEAGSVHDPATVMTGHLSLGPFDYPDENARRSFAQEIQSELRRIPGVSDAALSTTLPWLSAPAAMVSLTEAGDSVVAQHRAVSESFFRMFPMDFSEGISFGSTPESSDEHAVVITEDLARRLSPSAPAVGTQLRVGDLGPFRVAGVVRHPAGERGTVRSGPLVFRLVEHVAPEAFYFAVRTSTATPPNEIRRAVASIDANLPLERIQSLQDAHFDANAIGRRVAGLFTAFGLMAIVVTLAGLYGTVATVARRRRKELGLRRVLGASMGQLVMAAAGRTYARHIVGLLLGTGVAIAIAPFLRPVARGESPLDPVLFTAVPLLLAIVSGIAIYLPNRRAAGVDPMAELREE